MATTLTDCPTCGATAHACQLKHHFSGRPCCPDCHHRKGHDDDH